MKRIRMRSAALSGLLGCLLGTAVAGGQIPDLEEVPRPDASEIVSDAPATSTASPCQEEHKLQASDGTYADAFGYSVAMEGEVIAVGAFRNWSTLADPGSVYVFRWDGSIWDEQVRLRASDAAAESWFGRSVAVAGDIVAVGAPHDDDNGADSGAAYVFRWDGSTWNEEAKLLASDGGASDEFGQSVAASGDVIVIGAVKGLQRGFETGSAYIYRWDGSRWNEEAKLTASDGYGHDEFGRSVAISGDVVAVGTPLDEDRGASAGAVYVYRWDGSTWNEEAKLLASDGAALDEFGGSVAVSGDRIAVGAHKEDEGGENAGAAYVFGWDGSTWREEAKLLASDGDAFDDFGYAVGAAEGLVAVGAVFDVNEKADAGAVYVYRDDGTAWVERAKRVPTDGGPNHQFGISVAASETVVVAGGWLGDGRSAGTGYAYAYHCAEVQSSVVCDARAGDPAECSLGRGAVPLDGTGSYDPEGDPLTYLWTSVDCEDATFDDETSPTPVLETDGPPSCPRTCTVRLEVSDGPSGDACETTVTVRDTRGPEPTAGSLAPCFSTGSAAEAAALSETNWSDACHPSIREQASLAGTCDAEVRVQATDACGNTGSVVYSTRLDGEAPRVFPPPPGELECRDPVGIPLDDPEVQSWLARARSEDNCGLASTRHDAPSILPYSGCSGAPGTEVAFTAVDECGLEGRAASSLAVVDTTPPRILEVGYDGMCLWAPNHQYVEFPDIASLVEATDLCSTQLDSRVVGCVSSQADLARGSGSTRDDCVITPDGKGVRVRAERQGPGRNGRDGRRYVISVEVLDACDNVATARGTIFVPHDRRGLRGCDGVTGRAGPGGT